MSVCPKCQSDQADDALVCAACGALVHGPELKDLYARSRDAERAKDWSRCLEALLRCRELLPPGSKQHQQIEAQVRRISHFYSNQPPVADPGALESPDPVLAGANSAQQNGPESGSQPSPPKGLMAFPVCLGRAIAILIRGLTRPRTLVSMVVWVLLLGLVIGWRKSLGFALMIYAHEMGHVLAIQFVGLRFAWPVFVPFLGAFVLHGKGSGKARENVFISVSGPLTGILLSAVLYGVHRVSPLPAWALELGRLNVLINVMNLLPFWILDGGRIADCATRRQNAALALALIAFSWTPFNVFTLLAGVLFGLRALLFEQFSKHARIKVKDTSRLLVPLLLTFATIHVGCLLFALME